MNTKILIIFRASLDWGYGHLYRDIRLAQKFKTFLDVTLTSNQNSVIEDMMSKSKLNWFPSSDDEILSYIKNKHVEIVLIDRLNNSEKFIRKIKSFNCRVILLDDQGKGAYLADALINALVELPERAPDNSYYGADYVVYSEELEYYSHLPKMPERTKKKILVSFGGSDPNNISALMLPIIKSNPTHEFILVLGPGYIKKEELIEDVCGIKNINILHNVASLSKLIYEADLCVVSGGLTLYECMYLQKKSFVACQVTHQVDSAIRYQEETNIYGLGVVDKNSSNKLALITDYLTGKFDPFFKKPREFKNGLLQIEAIIKELI